MRTTGRTGGHVSGFNDMRRTGSLIFAKVRVAGSNPVVRSTRTPGLTRGFVLLSRDFAFTRDPSRFPGRPRLCRPVAAGTVLSRFMLDTVAPVAG
jgi:hypothetical protein